MDTVDKVLWAGGYGYVYEFFEQVCTTYAEQTGGAGFDLPALAEAARQVDSASADVFAEALEDTGDPGATMAMCHELGADGLAQRQTELAAAVEAADAPEDLDTWHAFLRGDRNGWDGTDGGWQVFREGFLADAASAGVPNAAEGLIAQAEGGDDREALLTAYGIPVTGQDSPSAGDIGEGFTEDDFATVLDEETTNEFAAAFEADGIDPATIDPAVLDEIIRYAAAQALGKA